jgi:hypothetical protein
VYVSNENGSHIFSPKYFYSSLLNILFIRRVRFDLSLNIQEIVKPSRKGFFFSSLVQIIEDSDVFELSLSMK